MIDGEFIFYKTSDIYFSAYLCALDVPLHTTESEKSNNAMNKKIIFIFKVPVKDLSRLKASYFGGSGTVRALKMVQQLRSLKSMCFT